MCRERELQHYRVEERERERASRDPAYSLAAVGRWTVRVLTARAAAAVIGYDAEATGGARAVSTKRTGVEHRRAAVASKRA